MEHGGMGGRTPHPRGYGRSRGERPDPGVTAGAGGRARPPLGDALGGGEHRRGPSKGREGADPRGGATGARGTVKPPPTGQSFDTIAKKSKKESSEQVIGRACWLRAKGGTVGAGGRARHPLGGAVGGGEHRPDPLGGGYFRSSGDSPPPLGDPVRAGKGPDPGGGRQEQEGRASPPLGPPLRLL